MSRCCTSSHLAPSFPLLYSLSIVNITLMLKEGIDEVLTAPITELGAALGLEEVMLGL